GIFSRQDRYNLLFDGFVRHHFAANFRESRKSAFDVEKTIFVESADIARLEPAVPQNFRGLFGIIEVAIENVWSVQPEHSGVVERALAVGIGIANFGCHPREELSRGTEPIAGLNGLPSRRCLWFREVYAHHR